MSEHPPVGSETPSEHVRIAVVGAGHAGLCVVGALRRRNIESVVFDDSVRLGDVWRNRYDGLILNTARDDSLIPGVPPDAGMGRWPTRDQWAAHIEAAGERFELERRRTMVERIEFVEDWWLLRTRSSAVGADVVVVATGRARIPVLPAWSNDAGSGVDIVHSSTFQRARDYAGRRVLVVGSGNSGAEIAHLLVDAGVETTWSIRTRPVWAKRDLFGSDLTTLAKLGKRLPDRLVDFSGRVAQPLLFGRLRPFGLGPPQRRLSRVAEASGATLDSGVIDDVKNGRVRLVGDVERCVESGVQLSDGSFVACDVVVAATGFGPGLDELMPADLLVDGWPRRPERPFEQAPGLFTAGLNPATLTAFHPDFISEAEVIAAAIAARLGRR